MCIVGAKFFPEYGWVCVKNRDRNYRPDIRIRKSFRNDTERLFVWDSHTKYSEGINEHSVAIVSAAVAVKDDEAEGAVAKNKIPDEPKSQTGKVFYSPDGIRIRKALYETSAEAALRRLIELQIPGNTIICDRERCFILEATFTPDDQEDEDDEEYTYKFSEIPQNRIVVRTNHGILLPWTGYSEEGSEEQQYKRKSSDIRYDIAVDGIKDAKDPHEMLDSISSTDNEDPQMNPLRLDKTRGAMRTTGQILITTGDNTLHYRPIVGTIRFKLDKLNHPKQNTFFEVISTRKLISFANQKTNK